MVLNNEKVFFIGALNDISSKQAKLVTSALKGFNQKKLTKQTTIVVIGDKTNNFVAEFQKATKILKVQKLISQGNKIIILSELEFVELFLRE